LQEDEPRAGRSRCDMILADLASGRRTRISADRGDLAQGCRLDAGALTEAAELIERAIRRAPPDLVVLNKFGKAEAEEGCGFRDVIAAALEADAPVLIAVTEAYAPALRDFAGDLCAFAEDEAAVWRWLRARLGARARFAEGEAATP
jgi:nucleoside-triphosphatase THEP1